MNDLTIKRNTLDLKYLHKKILPCDINSPYIFISYSSEDREIVWNDVVELQNRGYNLWIDEPNLDKTKPSWEEDALRAIESSNCILFAFYVSHHSLSSEACLNEIERTKGEQTIRTHFGEIDFFAIECEQIGHIGDYIQCHKQQIENSQLDQKVKDKMLSILYDFNMRWFTPDNKKVRIHFKSEHGRYSDYYEEIERELCRHQRGAKFRPERLYRFAVDNLIQWNQEKFDYAIRFLTIVADSYIPAALLLAHLLRNSAEHMNQERAVQLWHSVEKTIPASSWGQRGIDEEKRKRYSEAIAWLLAYGEKYNKPEYFYEAGKNWARKGSKEQTIAVLQIAASMGYARATEFLLKLQMKSTDDFFAKACTDEASL